MCACLENLTRIDFQCQKVFLFLLLFFWNFLMVVVLFACHSLVFHSIKFFLFHHGITSEFFCVLYAFLCVCEKFNELWMKAYLEFQTCTTLAGYSIEREKDLLIECSHTDTLHSCHVAWKIEESQQCNCCGIGKIYTWMNESITWNFQLCFAEKEINPNTLNYIFLFVPYWNFHNLQSYIRITNYTKKPSHFVL